MLRKWKKRAVFGAYPLISHHAGYFFKKAGQIFMFSRRPRFFSFDQKKKNFFLRSQKTWKSRISKIWWKSIFYYKIYFFLPPFLVTESRPLLVVKLFRWEKIISTLKGYFSPLLNIFSTIERYVEYLEQNLAGLRWFSSYL